MAMPRIYVLLRVSKTKPSLQCRVQEDIFDSRIFDTLRSQFSNEQEFQDKIVRKVAPVRGDIVMEQLGMSNSDLAIVQSDTKVVIHCVASVNFSDPLPIALDINTRGTLRVIQVAQSMPRIRALIHVSTCYVNAPLRDQRVLECIYPLPFGDPEHVFANLSKMSEDELLSYERDIVLKTYPNTYTFTKALTEHLMQERFQSLDLPLSEVGWKGIALSAYF
ncbi:cyclin-dependent kinase inhibitor far1 [Lunasporangiospora selenospora]|uniref:Fatty acyl-CoA reductase n=1 Tax=Lunasporangiospora selenospora TaxID=979761 RepID=A0A9P6FMG4_9FUNG|nr:cyclin-dependent kinase inhibitor far1 [Lunasporangiospora selenospora]